MPAGISTPRAVLLTLLIATGFGTGYAVRKAGGNSAPKSRTEMRKTVPPPRQGAARSSLTSADSAAAPLPVSTDTLEDLMALPEDDLYARLALWLADGTPEDFQAGWQALRQKKEPDVKLLDLLFMRWAASDPLGAVRAAAGTEFSDIPWRAWAKNDPDEALEHARHFDPGRLAAVIGSIGEFDPERALKLLEEYPQVSKSAVMEGAVSGFLRDNPEAAVKLNLQLAHHHEARPMEAWLRKEPHAAFAWLLENRTGDRHGYLTDGVVAALERENPELLAELKTGLASGEVRRKLEAAEFRQLAAKDPKKALAQARETTSERVSLDRYSQLALAHLQADPAKARDVFAELLERHPDPLSNGRTAYALIMNLMGEPEATMAVLLSRAPGGGAASWTMTTQFAAGCWIQDDSDSYGNWAVSLPDPKVKVNALSPLISRLDGQRRFAEALDYLVELPRESRGAAMDSSLRWWNHLDPKAAAEWLAAAPLADEDRLRLEKSVTTP